MNTKHKTMMLLVTVLMTVTMSYTTHAGDEGGGRANTFSLFGNDPTRHHDAQGRPYYIDRYEGEKENSPRPALTQQEIDRYNIRYYVGAGVDSLKAAGPFNKRGIVADGMGHWLVHTKNLVISREEPEKANLLITTSAFENKSELFRVTPSRKGRWKNLSITLNSNFKDWTPTLMKAVIIRAMGEVIGLTPTNEENQIMSRNFINSLNNDVFTPQLKDIEAVQKIFGKRGSAEDEGPTVSLFE